MSSLAVRVGDLAKFQDTLARYGSVFKSDHTYTLILRYLFLRIIQIESYVP